MPLSHRVISCVMCDVPVPTRAQSEDTPAVPFLDSERRDLSGETEDESGPRVSSKYLQCDPGGVSMLLLHMAAQRCATRAKTRACPARGR